MSEKKSWLREVLAAAQEEEAKLPSWMRRNAPSTAPKQTSTTEKEAKSKKNVIGKKPDQN